MAESTGAQAVADAVKKVADAAVAAVRDTDDDGKKHDFKFSGVVGGAFEIVATGGLSLGPSGTVKLHGAQLRTTGWSTMRITGVLPAEATPGTVTVSLDDKTHRYGEFKG